MGSILTKKNESVVEIILNRPPVNALNEELVEELYDTLQSIQTEKDIRVVILRSQLPVFISGADIKMMKELQENQETSRMLEYVKKLQETLTTLENMSKPTIAYINGHAMGGGLELALACDFRVMSTENTAIGLPEVQLGMIPGAGGTQRLTRIVGETKAKELIYFARYLSAQEALDLGIVSYICSSEKGLEKVYELANQLVVKAPLAIASSKRCIQSSGQNTLSIGLEKEISETENVFTSHDSKIGFTSFLEKKEPKFVGK